MRTLLMQRMRPQTLAVLAVLLATPTAAQTVNDLSALRYYVQQGDQIAIDAEMRRLRSAFPNWTPPADLTQLNAASPSADTDRIYQAIASGDLAGAQQIIDENRARYPEWVPPADMLSLLATALAQQQFDAAVASDPGAAERIARANPVLTRCDRVNNVWRLSEAHARAGQRDRARGELEAIVDACPRYLDVVASLQKANEVSSADQLAAMFATATTRFPENVAALRQVQTELGGGAAPPAAMPTAPARQSQPRRSEGTPEAPRIGSAGSAISVPATQWDRLPASGDSRIGAMRAAASSGAWGRCIALTPEPRSLEILNERGWCSLNLERPMEALAAFGAVTKGRVSSDVARDARYGMAMSYLQMKMSNDAAKIAAATNFTREQRVTVESEILVQRATEAYRTRDYARAIGYLDAAEQLRGGLNRGLGVLRAYAHLNAGRRQAAFEQFSAMHQQLAGDDTREGMNASR